MATTNNITVTGSSPTTSATIPSILAGSQQTNIVTSGTQSSIQTPDTSAEIAVQVTGLGGGAAPDTSTDLGLNGESAVYTLFFNSPRLGILKQTVTTADAVQSFKVNKGARDTGTTQEQLQKSVSAVKRDTATSADAAAKNISKTTQTDTVSRVDQIYLKPNKGIADQATKSDQIKLSISKIFFEQKYTSDQFTRTVAYNRVFTDLVDATDDFLGLANIDDDQTARVGKNLFDYAYTSTIDIKSVSFGSNKSDVTTAQDQKYLATNKIAQDQVIRSDLATLSLGKNLQDTSTTSELSTKRIGKINLDLASSSDQATKSILKINADISTAIDEKQVVVTKVFTDTFTKQDLVTTTWSAIRIFTDQTASIDLAKFSVQAQKQDQTTSADIYYINVGKSFLDQTTSLDLTTTQVNFIRLFTDVVDATDDFLGEANVDDDQVARIGKVLIDYPVTADNYIVFNAAKVLSDQTQTLDSPAFTTTKPFADSFQKSDQTSLTITKPFIDQSISIDTAIISVSKPFTDLVFSSDLDTKTINKISVDLLQSTDAITAFNINKNIIDYVNTLDVFSVSGSASRPSDVAQIQDPVALQTTKVIADQTATLDQQYAFINKTTEDTLAVKNADTVRSDFSKVSTDTTTSTDIPVIKPSIIKSDAVGISDSAIQLLANYIRNFSDIVDATDDFYGQANVDDDQTARVEKNVVEYAQTTDTKSFYFTSTKQDIATSTDNSYKRTGKLVADIAQTSDVLTFQKTTDRSVTDLQNVSDSVYLNWQDYCERNIFEPTYVGQQQFLSYN